MAIGPFTYPLYHPITRKHAGGFDLASVTPTSPPTLPPLSPAYTFTPELVDLKTSHPCFLECRTTQGQLICRTAVSDSKTFSAITLQLAQLGPQATHDTPFVIQVRYFNGDGQSKMVGSSILTLREVALGAFTYALTPSKKTIPASTRGTLHLSEAKAVTPPTLPPVSPAYLLSVQVSQLVDPSCVFLTVLRPDNEEVLYRSPPARSRVMVHTFPTLELVTEEVGGWDAPFVLQCHHFEPTTGLHPLLGSAVLTLRDCMEGHRYGLSLDGLSFPAKQVRGLLTVQPLVPRTQPTPWLSAPGYQLTASLTSLAKLPQSQLVVKALGGEEVVLWRSEPQSGKQLKWNTFDFWPLLIPSRVLEFTVLTWKDNEALHVLARNVVSLRELMLGPLSLPLFGAKFVFFPLLTALTP